MTRGMMVPVTFYSLNNLVCSTESVHAVLHVVIVLLCYTCTINILVLLLSMLYMVI